jgi:hypothetical protein
VLVLVLVPVAVAVAVGANVEVEVELEVAVEIEVELEVGVCVAVGGMSATSVELLLEGLGSDPFSAGRLTYAVLDRLAALGSVTRAVAVKTTLPCTSTSTVALMSPVPFAE